MKQINNGFKSYYYLKKDGTVYNEQRKTSLKADIHYSFTLRTIEGERKKISLKSLYKLVYNENWCVDTIEDLEGEIWKPIENTNNLYWISNKGRCKSLVNYEARILKVNYVKGYERVDIYQEGERSSKLVSRLVAAAFLDQPGSFDMQLHHIDGRKNNNCCNNLQWLTPKQHREIHRKQKEQKENGCK